MAFACLSASSTRPPRGRLPRSSSSAPLPLLRSSHLLLCAESALKAGGKREANVVAVGDVRVAKLTSADFEKVVGTSGVDDLLRRNFNRKVPSAARFALTCLLVSPLHRSSRAPW